MPSFLDLVNQSETSLIKRQVQPGTLHYDFIGEKNKRTIEITNLQNELNNLNIHKEFIKKLMNSMLNESDCLLSEHIEAASKEYSNQSNSTNEETESKKKTSINKSNELLIHKLTNDYTELITYKGQTIYKDNLKNMIKIIWTEIHNIRNDVKLKRCELSFFLILAGGYINKKQFDALKELYDKKSLMHLDIYDLEYICSQDIEIKTQNENEVYYFTKGASISANGNYTIKYKYDNPEQPDINPEEHEVNSYYNLLNKTTTKHIFNKKWTGYELNSL